MKKFITSILAMLIVVSLSMSVFAAPKSKISKPEIIKQPLNLCWPEGSIAVYTVEASGEDLNYHWYIVYDGVTYDTLKPDNGKNPPWYGFGIESVGQSPDGKSFYFTGITDEAQYAAIYCTVSNSAGSVSTIPAYINVVGENKPIPPEISVVSEITVYKGGLADIYCTAKANDGGSLSYCWYETTTGDIRNIIDINRGSETSDTLHCDTSKLGTRYYACMVETSKGGRGYTQVLLP